MTGTAAAAASVGAATVGTASAQQDCANAPVPLEGFDSWMRTQNSGPTTANGDELPVVVGGGLLLTLPTESYRFEEPDELTDVSDGCYDYRIDVTVTWNPTDSGPNNMGVFLYEGDGLETCIGSNENGEDDVNPQGENEISLTVSGDGTFSGANANGTQVTNDYTISSGINYTIGVQGRTGVADFEATAEVSAVDSSGE